MYVFINGKYANIESFVFFAFFNHLPADVIMWYYLFTKIVFNFQKWKTNETNFVRSIIYFKIYAILGIKICIFLLNIFFSLTCFYIFPVDFFFI